MQLQKSLVGSVFGAWKHSSLSYLQLSEHQSIQAWRRDLGNLFVQDLLSVYRRWVPLMVWWNGRPHKFGWQPPPQKKNTDGLKHHPVGVSGMRPFMDGIIENKVGNSLDSSLETQNHQPGSHRDWDLETSILISDSRIDYLSYHSLTFSAWHVQHVFNQSNFPLIKVSFSFSFLTSHPNPNHVSLGTPVTWNRTNVAFQAIGRNEFAFYFRSLGLENRFSRDSNRMVQAAINPATKNGEMWQCLEIFGKKKTTTEKTRFF